MKTRIMTVDLENDLNSDRCKSMLTIVPKLLNFFDDYKIKATFFTVTKLLNKYESEIKDISRKHEIASHSNSHTWLNPWNNEFEIKISKQKLEEYGIKCLGFRAPGFMAVDGHFNTLKKYGYEYDSSLATFFPGRYSHLGLPSRPFVNRGILEFPLPTTIYPAVNSGLPYLKLFHPLSKAFSKPYLFYLHPWELMEKKELPKTNSFVSSLLLRNSGRKAWKILQDYVESSPARWVSCREWGGNNR